MSLVKPKFLSLLLFIGVLNSPPFLTNEMTLSFITMYDLLDVVTRQAVKGVKVKCLYGAHLKTHGKSM